MSEVAYCTECGCSLGFFIPDDDEWESEMCCNCSLAEEAKPALEALREGDISRAAEQVAGLTYQSNSIVSQLCGEADLALQRGDAVEAEHLLRCAIEPKWKSIADCRAAYAAAMVEKQGAVA